VRDTHIEKRYKTQTFAPIPGKDKQKLASPQIHYESHVVSIVASGGPRSNIQFRFC
jgi:hypothetical protein